MTAIGIQATDRPPEMPPETHCRIGILLSTYNGARYLPDQLASFLAQTHANWTLFWRDDGSNDGTVALMEAFAAGPGVGRCVAVGPPAAHLGPTASFILLLKAAVSRTDVVGFADQDDVWLPEKLARGVAALARGDPARPALYCARQVLVDHALREMGLSAHVRRAPGFPAALTQNIATGCTVMMNHAAARLVASSQPPGATLHDWWSYLVVAAAGGRLIVDATPTVLYRQHAANLVGAPRSQSRRAMAALRRGPGVFMNVLRGHVTALRAQPQLLSPQARHTLDVIDRGLRQGPRHRMAALRVYGLKRQTWQETLLFRWWFMVG